MVSEVKIPLPANDSTFIVPKGALVNGTERVFVIKVVSNKTEWIDVKKGRESDGKIEVFGNLHPGDQVIKVATDEIRNGSTINTKQQNGTN